MSLKRLRRSLLAICLGIFALVTSGFEQNQFAGSVLWAAAAEIAAPAPGIDHVAMPDDCTAHHQGGHTHRGHSDCALCGALGALSAVSLPFIAVASGPAERAQRLDLRIPVAEPITARPSPYGSRAPPRFV